VSDERPLVLIAEDDEDVLVLVRTVLERSGHEVMVARDGAEALELAGARRPDLAVLDISMPELDGLEVLRRLRADEETCRMPVVLLSARSQEADVALGYETGASAYIRKPFSPRELTQRVAELLAS
jgi:DNA-binding response OmpR family regulator